MPAEHQLLLLWQHYREPLQRLTWVWPIPVPEVQGGLTVTHLVPGVSDPVLASQHMPNPDHSDWYKEGPGTQIGKMRLGPWNLENEKLPVGGIGPGRWRPGVKAHPLERTSG